MRVVSTAVAFPETVLTNEEIIRKLDGNFTSEWVEKNLGISERRIASELETSVDLAAEAVKLLIHKSGFEPSSIDLIIMATATPDLKAPACACRVQHKAGLINAIAFDIAAVCSGFLFALNTAAAYMKSGLARRVVVVAADTFSKITDWKKHDCVFFGDGAGAVLLDREVGHPEQKFNFDAELYTDGSGLDIFKVPLNGNFQMDAKSAFNAVSKVVPECIARLLKRNNMGVEDIDIVIPHQPSKKLLENIAINSGLPIDKFCMNMNKYGNTAGATIPIVLHDFIQNGRIKPGDNALLLAAGAGFTAGAALHRIL